MFDHRHIIQAGEIGHVHNAEVDAMAVCSQRRATGSAEKQADRGIGSHTLSGACVDPADAMRQAAAPRHHVEIAAGPVGQVRVQRAWSACDVGRAINPAMVTGQIEGGFVQGMGYALTEELVWDGPRLANPTLMDYKIPTFAELPAELKAIIVETHEPSGPFGAKSVGEIGINAVAAAIANAVSDATGARLRQLPLTGERVLDAIGSQGT